MVIRAQEAEGGHSTRVIGGGGLSTPEPRLSGPLIKKCLDEMFRFAQDPPEDE